MLVVAVVGIKGSGKTTVVTNLTAAMTADGIRVGTMKSIDCPDFSLDKEGSNTALHAQAGARVVAARSRDETVLIFPKRVLPLSTLLLAYEDCDVVLLEGDYDADVPRIVCGHTEFDAKERINKKTIAVSGRVAFGRDTVGGLPTFDVFSSLPAFVQLLKQRI